MIKQLIINILTFLLIGNVFSQNRILKGQIIDEKFEPIEFVTIKTLQNGNVFITDKFGKFEFEIDESETKIQVNYVGLHSEIVNIHNKCFINIVMMREHIIEFETIQEETEFYKKLKRKMMPKYKEALRNGKISKEENCR